MNKYDQADNWIRANASNRLMLIGRLVSTVGSLIMLSVVLVVVIAFLVILVAPSKPTAQEQCIEAAQSIPAIDRCMGR